jgi:hypothetical protein
MNTTVLNQPNQIGNGATIQLAENQEDKFIFIFRLLDAQKNNLVRVQDIRILGEAMLGRPPSESTVKLQVHRLRARCLTSSIIENCIQCVSDQQFKNSESNKDDRRQIIVSFLNDRMQPLLKSGLKTLFPDVDTTKIMEQVYAKINHRISELLSKKKKAKISFTKARHSKSVQLNITCNLMQIMMTA